MVNISTKTRIFIPLGQRSLVKMKSLDLDRLRLLFGALQRKGKVISKKQRHHQNTFLLIRSYDKIIFLYPCLKYTSSPFHSQLPSRKQCPPNYVQGPLFFITLYQKRKCLQVIQNKSEITAGSINRIQVPSSPQKNRHTEKNTYIHSSIVKIIPPEQKSEVILVRGGFGSEAAWGIQVLL